MNFTENEKAIFRGSGDNEFDHVSEFALEFDDALEGGSPWLFSVIAASGLTPEEAKNSLSSLAQKGVITISDSEGKGRYYDLVFSYTPLGLQYALNALGYVTDTELHQRLSDQTLLNGYGVAQDSE